jgi:hypothetical protein
MRLKEGVNPIGLKNEMLLGCFIVDGVYEGFFKYECVATSMNDSSHHETSRHYLGMATDFRIRHLPEDVDIQVAEEITRRLGKHYYVALKVDHIHVSYKPRKP